MSDGKVPAEQLCILKTCYKTIASYSVPWDRHANKPTAVQSQQTVAAHITSKQVLSFGFAEENTRDSLILQGNMVIGPTYEMYQWRSTVCVAFIWPSWNSKGRPRSVAFKMADAPFKFRGDVWPADMKPSHI